MNPVFQLKLAAILFFKFSLITVKGKTTSYFIKPSVHNVRIQRPVWVGSWSKLQVLHKPEKLDTAKKPSLFCNALSNDEHKKC